MGGFVYPSRGSHLRYSASGAPEKPRVIFTAATQAAQTGHYWLAGFVISLVIALAVGCWVESRISKPYDYEKER